MIMQVKTNISFTLSISKATFVRDVAMFFYFAMLIAFQEVWILKFQKYQN